MKIRITSDGKFILAGATSFRTVDQNASEGGGGTPSLATTMVLDDFKTSHSSSYPVVQRKAGTLFGNVPVLFSFTGTAPSNPQARVIRSDNSNIVKDWTTLENISVVGTTALGTLSNVPQGCYYYLQIRDGSQPNNSATISNGTVKWGVGVNILALGQSNMVSTLDAGNYADIVPGSSPSRNESDYLIQGYSTGAYFSSSGWVTSGGTLGGNARAIGGGSLSLLRIVAKALENKYGYKVPVGFVPYAWNNHSIDQFLPTTTGTATRWDQLFDGAGTTGGTIGFKSPKNYYAGDFEVVVYHQGEADSGTKSRAVFLERLKSVYQNLLAYVAPYGRNATTLSFLPAVLGSYGGVVPTASQSFVENIRGAVLDLDTYARANNWPRVRAGWNCIDLDASENADGLHFLDTGTYPYRKWSHRRMVQSILHQLDCTDYSGLGPRLSTTTTRSGDVVTLTVNHEKGTNLVARSGGAPSGFLGNTSADFSGTDITVTAAITGPSTIQVTFPSGTAYPVYLKYMGSKPGLATSIHPNVSNPVYDNVTYPAGATGTDIFTGLPLVPTVDSIVIN